MINECQCSFCKYHNTSWRDFPCNVCMSDVEDYYEEKQERVIANEEKQYGNETNYKL